MDRRAVFVNNKYQLPFDFGTPLAADTIDSPTTDNDGFTATSTGDSGRFSTFS